MDAAFVFLRQHRWSRALLSLADEKRGQAVDGRQAAGMQHNPLFAGSSAPGEQLAAHPGWWDRGWQADQVHQPPAMATAESVAPRARFGFERQVSIAHSNPGSGRVGGSYRFLGKKKKKQGIGAIVRMLHWLDNHLPIILPTDWKRRYWEFLILAFVIYNAVSVPHEAAFAYTKSVVQSRMEDIIDVLFALDVFYTFRTAYIDTQGEMVRDGGKIVSNYLGSWFPIDILASLPLEYIVLIFGLSGSANLTYFAFLKTPRLLRLGRLLRFLDKIKNANVFRIIRLMCMMCLIAHWTACAWHLLIVYNPDLDFVIERTGNLMDEYLDCFYGSFLLMVGDNVDPQNNVESIFCCIMLVLGCNFYATVVGNMALLVSNLNATAARHQQRAELMQEAMRYLEVSDPVQTRVQEYYDYLLTFGHPGPDLMRHVQELPESLGTDMAIELYKPTVAKIPLFYGVKTVFLEHLTRGLSLCVFLKGEYIYREGDSTSALRICQKGKVAIVRADGVIEDMLCDGAHFGMQSLLSPGPCCNNAVGLSNCDIMVLSRELIAAAVPLCSTSSAAVRKNFANLQREGAGTSAAAARQRVEQVSKEPAMGDTKRPDAQPTISTAAPFSTQIPHLPSEVPATSYEGINSSAQQERLQKLEQLLETIVAKANTLELNQAKLSSSMSAVMEGMARMST